jgi:hypothetical protein
VERSIVLTKVYRQKDQEFVDMLNDFRIGCVTEASVRLLCTSPSVCFTAPVARVGGTDGCGIGSRCAASCGTAVRGASDGIEPTLLFAKNVDVDSINAGRLRQLEGAQTE